MNRSIPASHDLVRRNAQSHFRQAEARTDQVRKMAEEERLAVTAKIAKLRALRLAKEEEDRLKGAESAANDPKTANARKNKSI